ncbi:MAG: twin-arginine translocase TatA/TatE family subunit [Candidatus Omnitrophica bacterium]|nr:twin-arginine translocase TatA/TatE family subunit [Candidatus Omnitrophota bacterium]
MRFGILELTVILLIILVLFGPKKLPELARALGKAIREFRKAGKETKDNAEEEEIKEEEH